MTEFDDVAHEGSWIVAAIGALNWAVQETTGTNLVTDTAGLGPEVAGMVYLVIGLAGVVSLYYYYELEVMS